MLNTIRQVSPFDALNADEGLLLDALIVQWHERDNIMVSELMRDVRFGSQPTVYRRIIALQDKGVVCLRPDNIDKRVKFVEPTQVARDYMASINECVASLRQSPQNI